MRFIRCSVLMLCLLVVGLRGDNPVSVPLGHPVYAFLDRMETLGVLPNLMDGVRPLPRSTIARWLMQIDRNRFLLTRIDRERLDNFLLDFRWEIDPGTRYPELPEDRNWYSPLSSWGQFKKDLRRFLKRNQPEEEFHTLVWEDSSGSFYLDLIQDLTYDRRSDGKIRMLNMQTYYIRGTIGKNFGFAARASQAALYGEKYYREAHPEVKGTFLQDHGRVTYFDRSGGEMALDLSYFEIRFAQQFVQWGLGESGQFIISDYADHFPYFQLQKRWRRVTFSFIHGKLVAEASGDTLAGRPYYPDKWIVAHRLEISPWDRFSLAFTESYIYGNRGVEWAYLLPLNMYRATEHYLLDRDNKTIALDAELRLQRGLKIYGTLFLDEFRQSKLFTNWYGNKHAVMLGFVNVDPFRIPNFSIRVEYVAIMPWVYTHKYAINRYINNLQPLGYWAGPNSEVWYIHLQKEFHRRLIGGLQLRQWKHGENYPNENIGGDILLGRNVLLGNQQVRRQTRKFLEGILRTEKQIRLYIQYELFNDLFLNLQWQAQSVTRQNSRTNATEWRFGFRWDY